jgi:hypothetical protein
VRLTPYQRLADALLQTQGTTLPILVLDLADAGASPAVIAQELANRTGGAVDITREAARLWLRQFREHESREVA